MPDLRLKFEQSLGWAFLLIILGACLMVMLPFVSALLWAAVLSFSLWPLHRRLVHRLGGRRTLAATLIAGGLILVILLPFLIVGVTLADNVQDLTNATRRWIESGPPSPPAWLPKVPIIGKQATERWQDLAADSAKLSEQAKQFIEPVGAWILRAGIGLGSGLLQLALSILITFFFLRNGPSVAATLNAIIQRIAGERGKLLLDIAGSTVRGVVYGILGTALVQAVMAGVGLVIAGVPGSGLLALLIFFLSVVPAGPFMVMLPAALWLFHTGQNGWGIFMLIWGVGVSTVDNFVKPWLISQGSDMPLILIFFGVLGGALTFGFIGVFIGPTLLAVGYRLVDEWASLNVPNSSHPEPVPAAEAKQFP